MISHNNEQPENAIMLRTKITPAFGNTPAFYEQTISRECPYADGGRRSCGNWCPKFELVRAEEWMMSGSPPKVKEWWEVIIYCETYARHLKVTRAEDVGKP